MMIKNAPDTVNNVIISFQKIQPIVAANKIDEYVNGAIRLAGASA